MISVTNRAGFAAAGLIMFLASFGRADTLAKWTFEGSNTAAAVGSGTASYVGGTVLSDWVVGYPSGGVAWSTKSYPAQSTADRTAGVRFDVSTSGYTNIMVSFVWQASKTGSSNGVFQISTDGGANFTNEWPLSSGPGISSWKSLSFDLSTNGAASNCTTFCFRFVSAFAAGTSSYTAANGGSSYGTNGTWKFDEVTVSGTPLTALGLAITTPSSNALTVANTVAAYDLAGTSSNLVGNLAWTNTLTAGNGTLPASPTWSISGLALAVGANAITVSGTNAMGNSAGATVTITRQAPPALTITNPAAACWAVDADTINITLAGAASSLSGSIQWTNALTGAAGAVAGAAAWSITGIALSPGTNAITVSANSGALTAAVQIVRLPPGTRLKPGDIALIGWDDTSDLFSFLTLAAVTAGTAICFTDNGWSNTQFRGASANAGASSEDLLKFLAVQTIPAGTIIRTSDSGATFEWVRGETIPGGGGTAKFSALSLPNSGGEQVYAFQGPYLNPLWSPTVQLFVLDDSGAFEVATNSNTGDVPPGLTAGVTALTFPQSGSSQHVMVFTNFDGLARTKTQWLAFIANSNNWFFGETGDLPTNSLTVAPPPLLTVQAGPAGAGATSGGGRYDEGELATLSATPARGWVFARWSDGDTHATRTFAMPATDTTITAFFAWRSTVLLVR